MNLKTMTAGSDVRRLLGRRPRDLIAFRRHVRGFPASPPPPGQPGARGHRRDHLSNGRAGGEGANGHVLPHHRQSELRNQGDADAGRDQTLDRLVVVALERHVRLEPGRVAAAHDVARAGLERDVCTQASCWRSCRRSRSRPARAWSREAPGTWGPRAAPPWSCPPAAGSRRRTRTAAPDRAGPAPRRGTISSGSPSASVSSTSG